MSIYKYAMIGSKNHNFVFIAYNYVFVTYNCYFYWYSF